MSGRCAKPPDEPRGWLRSTWEKIATVMAVISLVDITGQLIKWMALIHWVATHYAIARAWLFGWLPFHIPPEWHDPIVLTLILLSVTNVGVHRKTRHTFIYHFVDEALQLLFLPYILLFITLLLVLGFLNILSLGQFIAVFLFGVGGAFLLLQTAIILRVMLMAWHWLLITAAFFGALVAINQVYVLWLEPLAEH
jgi:hypothetical protein